VRNSTGRVPNCVTFRRRPVDATVPALTIAACVVYHRMFVCIHLMYTGIFCINIAKLQVVIL